MADHSTIEWTEATWNPIAGCSVVSPGCTNCYAMRRVAPRLSANPATPHYAGTVTASKAGPVWTGKIGIASDKVLTAPLRWKRPRMIFVNSTSDLFHEGVPDAVIDRTFAVMVLSPQHTLQVLTKRPERMRAYFEDITTWGRIDAAMNDLAPAHWHKREWEDYVGEDNIIPNVWLGTSVEDQRRADERIPHLLATPAAVRFISAEPLLGPIDLTGVMPGGGVVIHALKGTRHDVFDETFGERTEHYAKLHWVIVGGESGTGARPMHPDWARSLRDQCAAANVPFFFKQWGEWMDVTDVEPKPVSVEDRIFTGAGKVIGVGVEHGRRGVVDPDWREQGGAWMLRVNKHAAGRLLDGLEHNAMPGSR